MRAAAQVAHALQVPFLLTARAKKLLHGRNDRADTIGRLQAYEAAGADVLYAAGLRNLDEVREVVRAVNRPVNGSPGGLIRYHAGAAERETDQRRRRALPPRAGDLRQGGSKYAGVRRLRVDARHDRHRGAAEHAQVLVRI